LTNSVENSSSWEDYSFSANQEISHISRNSERY